MVGKPVYTLETSQSPLCREKGRGSSTSTAWLTSTSNSNYKRSCEILFSEVSYTTPKDSLEERKVGLYTL